MNRVYSSVLAPLVLFAAEASSEIRRPLLAQGMGTQEVVRLWGEPSEIQEHEVKRQQVWSYGKGESVTIRESKVVSWQSKNQNSLQDTTLVHQAMASEGAHGKGAVEPLNETRDLVSEIARELPSGPDVPYSEPPATDSSTAAVAPPPIPPQQAGGMYANPPGTGFQPYVANEED